MIFTNDKAIYIQMADRLCDEILSGVYKDDDTVFTRPWFAWANSLFADLVLRKADILFPQK